MKIQEINAENRFQSKEYINRKKKIKKRLFWIKFILIFILSISALIFLALSPIFNIKSIEVEGSTHYSKTEIKNATNLTIGENGFKTIGSSLGDLFTLQFGLEEKNIKGKFPYVKSVNIRFVLPNKIKIRLKERKPFIYFNYNGAFLFIDKDAYVVDLIQLEKTKSLLEIKGLKFQNYILGQELNLTNHKQIEIFNKIYEALEKADKNDDFKVVKQLKYVDVSDIQRVVINLNSKVSINFGDLFDLSYKIDFMKKNIAAIPKSEKGYLDMTLDQPVFKPENE